MQIAQGMKLCAAAGLFAASTGAFAALPGRIEYAVNFGKESASVGRFLPVGATFWKEGKAWNQSTSSAVSPTQGYDDVSDIYRTYVYPNDATVGLSAAYLLPGLTPGASYTLRLHLCEVYFTESGYRTFDVKVNGVAKASGVDAYELAGGKLQGAYVDIPVEADSSGSLTVEFVNVANQYNVCALEVFSASDALPVPVPRVCRESRGVNRLTMETRNAAYLYDVECRSGESGAARVLASGVSGLRVIDIRGTGTTQYRARAVIGGAKGEWSEWTPVDSSAYASDVVLKIACADPGQTAPDGWIKDIGFRVFPEGADAAYKTRWENYDLTWFPESERPPLLVFQLAVVQGNMPLSYRFTGLDPARSYRVRIHQLEPNSGYKATYRYFAYHLNSSKDRSGDINGNTTVDPYIVAGNAACRAAAVDYEVAPDSAGTVLVSAENINNYPNWFGFEIHPLGEVKDPNPPGLSIIVR